MWIIQIECVHTINEIAYAFKLAYVGRVMDEII
jgi:hypothetical protein